ncbi:MAG: translation initiation factor IF-2, partial [Anaerovoracaceae bacterium]
GDRPARPQGDRPYGDRPARPQGDRPYGDRPARPQGDRPQGDRPARPQGDRPYGDRPARPQGDRPYGDRPARPQGDRPQGDRPQGNRPPGNRPYGDRPQGNRPQGDRPQGNRPPGSRPYGDRPQGSRPYGDRPQGNRPPRDDKPQLDKLQIKPSLKIAEKKPHDHSKDRDKFAKLEGANKGPKKPIKERSLEKKAKPKKHIKPKPMVIEPEVVVEELPIGTVILDVPITVAGFCEQTEVTTSRVIMALMKLGIMANINQSIDEDTVMILAEMLGINVIVGNVEEEIEEEGIELFEDNDDDLKARPPIITVMGHVDHGKTSLLDAIRKTNVTSTESGGITQHIGASEVKINGQKIVFLDTPGHEAFTAMRARGAHVTDIAILVVAADDSVKPQTIESISHAKAAGVPIIVAINKMDKPGANPDTVKKDLSEHGVLVEEWGGDVIAVPVSAKSGDGIVNLLEMVLLQAEVLELKANPNRLAMGSVIEARLDKSKGPVATLLVTNGTLHSGTSIVAGTCSGKIRLMTDFKGKTIKKAGPATAVEILGLTEVPEAGDEFNAVKEDKMAREIAENRKDKLREEVLMRNSSTTLEQLFSQIQEGEIKELNLIIKGDVQGSVGALTSSLEKLVNENVRVKILHTGVGTVTESDVMLAGTSGAIILGFNVRPSTAVAAIADREKVEIRNYRVIYDAIDDIENAMKGMLDPEFKEEVLGKVQIRNTFKVPGIGIIGGAYVTEGKVVRNAEVRLVRDGIVIHEGKISSLKRFKDDAKEVATGYECGIGIENYNDIKEDDIIECFHMVEIERK